MHRTERMHPIILCSRSDFPFDPYSEKQRRDELRNHTTVLTTLEPIQKEVVFQEVQPQTLKTERSTKSLRPPLSRKSSLRTKSSAVVFQPKIKELSNPHPNLVIFDVGEEAQRFFVHTAVLCRHSKAFARLIRNIEDNRKRKIVLRGVDTKTFGRFIQFIYDGKYDFPKASHIDATGKVDDWLEKSAEAQLRMAKDQLSVETLKKPGRESPKPPEFWQKVRYSSAIRFIVPPSAQDGKEAYILNWGGMERLVIFNEVGRPDTLNLDFQESLSAHSQLYHLAVKLALSDLQLFTLTHVAYTLLSMLPLVELSRATKESFLYLVNDTFNRTELRGQRTGLKIICARFWGLFRPRLQVGIAPVDSHHLSEIENNEEFMFTYFGELGWIVKALGAEKDYAPRKSVSSGSSSDGDSRYRYVKAFLPVRLEDYLNRYGYKLGEFTSTSWEKLQMGRKRLRKYLMRNGSQPTTNLGNTLKPKASGIEVDLEKQGGQETGDPWCFRDELARLIDCSLLELCSDSE